MAGAEGSGGRRRAGHLASSGPCQDVGFTGGCGSPQGPSLLGFSKGPWGATGRTDGRGQHGAADQAGGAGILQAERWLGRGGNGAHTRNAASRTWAGPGARTLPAARPQEGGSGAQALGSHMPWWHRRRGPETRSGGCRSSAPSLPGLGPQDPAASPLAAPGHPASRLCLSPGEGTSRNGTVGGTVAVNHQLCATWGARDSGQEGPFPPGAVAGAESWGWGGCPPAWLGPYGPGGETAHILGLQQGPATSCHPTVTPTWAHPPELEQDPWM